MSATDLMVHVRCKSRMAYIELDKICKDDLGLYIDSEESADSYLSENTDMNSRQQGFMSHLSAMSETIEAWRKKYIKLAELSAQRKEQESKYIYPGTKEWEELWRGDQWTPEEIEKITKCEEKTVKPKGHIEFQLKAWNSFFKGFDELDIDGKLKFLAEKIFALTQK